MPNTTYILLVALLPLASFIGLGLFGKRYANKTGGIIATAILLLSTLLAFHTAWSYFFGYGKINGVYEKAVAFKYTWLQFSEGMSIDMGAIIDPISAMMLVVVTFVSLMVHIYSLGYLKGEKRFATYYAYLSLFTFSMLGLVLSSNIFQMYFFWELVGVSSFLLIGFYYDKPSAVAACKKAFIVTRFADLGFLIGILILSYYAHSFDFIKIIERLATENAPEANAAVAASFMGLSALSWGLALVFIGGAGKSAMFPLHIWLPDAMEGPTPVSALIHAATMVVAGVFLLARLFHPFSMSYPVLHTVAYIGAFSALFAAIIACTQTDIKRVLAYSTMSQIGFMMFALGVSGANEIQGDLGFTAGMFHLFTHAMFKALLFLGAGAVIHFVHSNEMKDMGGLRKKLPVTHITFLIACLAIAGIPPFAGFFSKEEILLAAWEKNKVIFYLAISTSALTAFYMFRLYFRIFWNTSFNETVSQPHAHDNHHGEGGVAMMLPLVLLATASLLAGFVPFGNFVSADGKAVHTELHLLFSIAPVTLALAGIFTASVFYKNQNDKADKMAAALNGLYKAAFRKFYIDELYIFFTKKIIVNCMARPAAWVDKNIVDGLVNRTADATAFTAEKIRGLQSGKVQQYAVYFLAGVTGLVILVVYLWK